MAKPGVQKHRQSLCPHRQTREHTLIIFANQKVLPRLRALSAQDLPEACCAGFIHPAAEHQETRVEKRNRLGLREGSGRGPGSLSFAAWVGLPGGTQEDPGLGRAGTAYPGPVLLPPTQAEALSTLPLVPSAPLLPSHFLTPSSPPCSCQVETPSKGATWALTEV